MNHTVVEMDESDDSAGPRSPEVRDDTMPDVIVNPVAHPDSGTISDEEDSEERVGVFDYIGSVPGRTSDVCGAVQEGILEKSESRRGDKTSCYSREGLESWASEDIVTEDNRSSDGIEMQIMSKSTISESSVLSQDRRHGNNFTSSYTASLCDSGSALDSGGTAVEFATSVEPSRVVYETYNTGKRYMESEEEIRTRSRRCAAESESRELGGRYEVGGSDRYGVRYGNTYDGRAQDRRRMSYEHTDVTTNAEMLMSDRSDAHRSSLTGKCEPDAGNQSSSTEVCREDDDKTQFMPNKLVTLYGDSGSTSAEMAHRGGNFFCFNEYPSFFRPVEGYSERNSEIHRRALRKRQKKERREGSYHKAEEHPEYKGDKTIDELLAFINHGQSHGTKNQLSQTSMAAIEQSVEAGKDKPTRRKKKSTDHDGTSYFSLVLCESASRNSNTESHPTEAGHWPKNSSNDDSFLQDVSASKAEVVSDFKASSIFSVKTESNENNSETDSVISSLQECCLSDGGIDMTSSSFNDREFTTVYKKKRVKGSQPSININRGFPRNNDLKFSSNVSDFASHKVHSKTSASSKFSGTPMISDDRTNVPHKSEIGTNTQAAPNIRSGASNLGFSYAKAVGESCIDIDTNSVLCSTAFPHLRRNSAENVIVSTVESSSISSPPSECSSETTSGVSSMKEYPISYASIAASTLLSSGAQGKRRQTDSSSQRERERRHSFDSGTESLPVKSRTDMTNDDMHSADEFPSITSRNVGSAHALCSFESHNDADNTIDSGTLNTEIMGSIACASDRISSSDNDSSSRLSLSASKDLPEIPLTVQSISTSSVILPDKSIDQTLVLSKSDDSGCLDSVRNSENIVLGIGSLESSLVKTGENATSISCNQHSPMGIQYLEESMQIEPVVFLDKRSDRYDKLPKELEISFGFDSDIQEEYDSSSGAPPTLTDQAMIIRTETSTACSTGAVIGAASTASPIDSLTRQNSSVVSVTQCNPSTTHSRPIALMSGTSSSQPARAPVGVVPPLHHDRQTKSSSDFPSITHELSDKTADSEDHIEKAQEPWMKPRPPGNSCKVSAGRKQANFDLFSAQLFLYKGFEDTISARSQCAENIIHYIADSEGY